MNPQRMCQRSLSSSFQYYKGTPLFRTSEMRTSCFNGRFAPVRIAFPLTAIHSTPWNAETLLFCKADKFFGPFSTWTVQNSLDNADTHLPLTQGCPPPLIDSTTGHYNSTGSHSTSLWSAFLVSIQQGRALERAFVALNSTGMYCHAYRKYTRSLRNTDASIIWMHSDSPMVFTIEGVPVLAPNRGENADQWRYPYLKTDVQ